LYTKGKAVCPFKKEGTNQKHSYQMDTIKVPTALQSQKKISEVLSGMSGKCKMPCPVKDVLHHTSDKWSTLVMMVLGQEKTLRFNELKTAIAGISQKMLTVTLKNLERYGFIERKMYPQIPPKVEYTITPMGEEYLQHFVVMLTWACNNLGHIAAAQKKNRPKKSV
jgi:DNA-binding HxlR family transcriptional regulator